MFEAAVVAGRPTDMSRPGLCVDVHVCGGVRCGFCRAPRTRVVEFVIIAIVVIVIVVVVVVVVVVVFALIFLVLKRYK